MHPRNPEKFDETFDPTFSSIRFLVLSLGPRLDTRLVLPMVGGGGGASKVYIDPLSYLSARCPDTKISTEMPAKRFPNHKRTEILGASRRPGQRL